MQAPGRGSVKGAALEPPSRSITRPQAMVFAGIGKNHRARCKMIHFATSPFLRLESISHMLLQPSSSVRRPAT